LDVENRLLPGAAKDEFGIAAVKTTAIVIAIKYPDLFPTVFSSEMIRPDKQHKQVEAAVAISILKRH
jgi:hypothetical protein